MNIAELFVRLRADNSDLDRKLAQSERQLGRLHGSTTRLEGGFKSATFQTGRLGNQFASLAGQIAGVHPIVGNLAQVMGNFAIGGFITVGVLGGVAAMALVWDRFTKASREAKKAQDELLSSLEKANFRELLGPEPDLVLQTNAQRNALRAQQQQRRKLLAFGVDEDDERILDLNRQIANSQRELEQGEKRLFDARMAAGKGLETVHVQGTKLKDTYMQLRQEIERTRKAVEEEGRAWWANYSMKAFADEELTKSLASVLLPDLDVNKSVGALKDFGTTISGVDTNIGLTKEQIKTRDALVGTLDKNTLTIKDAIWGAASQSAGIIVNALNIGGGGKGSSLGGALGGTAGTVGGMMIGAKLGTIGGAPGIMVGAAIGALVGTIGGSFLGGLFDNKEAVNSNTSAVRALTQAMLLGAPSGFRIEPYRYGASTPVARNPGNTTVNIYGVTDAKEVARVVSKYATRGGAPLLAGT